MVERYTYEEEDLIRRCISVSCWNKRLERFCSKEGEDKAKECISIIRSLISDMKLVTNYQKEGPMERDLVKDVMALEEALINMDKKIDETIKVIQSEEFIAQIAAKLKGINVKE